MKKNDLKFKFSINQNKISKKLGYKPKLVWLYGLSGSGKSTIINQVQIDLFKKNIMTIILDGDHVRNGINSDLGFSEDDRLENIRRVAEISKVLLDNGQIVLCSFITPLNSHKELVNKLVGKKNIIWIFIDTPIQTCINRDPKGLYKKALNNEILNFTGITQKFEFFDTPNLTLNGEDNVKINSEIIISELIKKQNK